METMVFLCKDSLEGIFTGVYDAWSEALSSGLGHAHCRLETGDMQPELFCTCREVPVSSEKAGKVMRTIRKRLGEDVFIRLCYAAASCAPDKADAVYHTIVAGLSMKNGRKVLDKVTDPYVARCFAIQQNVGREIHCEYEFLRFQELENGVLFAKINPKNNILMYLGEHFSNRLPLEHFIIYDTNRHTALFHHKESPGQEKSPLTNAGKPSESELRKWYMMDALQLDGEAEKRLSTEEEYYQRLFRMFCHTISIESRENKDLQRQNLPLRYRGYMPEFMREK